MRLLSLVSHVTGSPPNNQTLQDELARSRELQKGITVTEADVAINSYITPITTYRLSDLQRNNRVYTKTSVAGSLTSEDIRETMQLGEKRLRNDSRRIITVDSDGRTGVTLLTEQQLNQLETYANRLPPLSVSDTPSFVIVSAAGLTAFRCALSHVVTVTVKTPMFDAFTLTAHFDSGLNAATCAHRIEHALNTSGLDIRQHDDGVLLTVAAARQFTKSMVRTHGRTPLRRLAKQSLRNTENQHSKNTYAFNHQTPRDNGILVQTALAAARPLPSPRSASTPEKRLERTFISVDPTIQSDSVTLTTSDIPATWTINKDDGLLPPAAVSFFEIAGFEAIRDDTLRFPAVRPVTEADISHSAYPIIPSDDGDWYLAPTDDVVADIEEALVER